MTLKNLIRIIRRRLLAILIPVLAGMGIYAYAFLKEPVWYSATSRLVVQVPQGLELFRQSPTGRRFLSPGDLITLASFAAGEKVQTLADELLQRDVLVLRKDEVRLYGEIRETDTGWVVTGMNGREEKVAREAVLRTEPKDGRKLADLATVSVTQGEGGNFLIVQARSRNQTDALMASRIYADAAVLASMDQAQEAMTRAITYIDGQIAKNDAGDEKDPGIAPLEKRLQEIGDRHNTIDMDRKYGEIRERILQIEAQIEEKQLQKQRQIQAQENLRTRNSREAHVRVGAVPVGLRNPERRPSTGSPAMENLRGRLIQLRVQLADMMDRYTPSHPDVKKTQELIRKIEADYLAEVRVETRYQMDEKELELENEIRLLDAEIAGLAARRTGKQADLDAIKADYSAYVDARERRQVLLTDTRTLADLRKRVEIERTSSQGSLIFQGMDKAASQITRKTDTFFPIAVLLSIACGFGFAYLLEFMDTTIRTDYDVRRHLNIPVTGIVEYGRKEVFLPQIPVAHPISDNYDRMATLVVTAAASAGNAILITSPGKGDGKTTISVNLATAIARQGRRVALIDGDLRLPSIHKFLGLDNGRGLINLLEKMAAAADAEGDVAIVQEAMQETSVPNLSVITAGSGSNAIAILSPERVTRTVAALRQIVDFVVFDSSPVLMTSEPLKIASSVNLCYLVLSAGETIHTRASLTKQLLKNVGADVAGVFLNRAPTEETESYYYYYYDYTRGGGRGRRRR